MTVPSLAGTAAGDRAAAIDALVDEVGLDSFPASDPPPFWAGVDVVIPPAGPAGQVLRATPRTPTASPPVSGRPRTS